jgi:hypothetical protein
MLVEDEVNGIFGSHRYQVQPLSGDDAKFVVNSSVIQKCMLLQVNELNLVPGTCGSSGILNGVQAGCVGFQMHLVICHLGNQRWLHVHTRWQYRRCLETVQNTYTYVPSLRHLLHVRCYRLPQHSLELYETSFVQDWIPVH